MEKIFLSPKELSALLGVSKVTLWRLQKTDPSFPKCHQISAKKKIWRTVDVEEWINRLRPESSTNGGI